MQRRPKPWFSLGCALTEGVPLIVTDQGNSIEFVTSYKYVGFILDQELSFNDHIQKLTRKLRVKLGFFYCNKACFSEAPKGFGCFYASIGLWWFFVYNANAKCLKSLDTISQCLEIHNLLWQAHTLLWSLYKNWVASFRCQEVHTLVVFSVQGYMTDKHWLLLLFYLCSIKKIKKSYP